MFKLIKIINGRINQPEPQKMPSYASVSYRVGHLVKIEDGKLVHCTATDTPQFLVAESAASAGKTELFVYPIDLHQVYETTISVAPDGIKVGDKVTLNIVNGKAEGITSTKEDGVATIYELPATTKAGGKVLVTFHS